MAVLGRWWISGSLLACLLVSAGAPRCPGQPGEVALAVATPNAGSPDGEVPDAPEPQQETPPALLPAGPCDLQNVAATMAATAALRASTVAEAEGAPVAAAPRIVGLTLCVPHMSMINWYARFLNGPQVKRLTPREKAHLAASNLIDPFNILTIAGEGAIAVAANPHSPEGPGMHGYANYLGVSFTEDITGEFFGTFLIPSLTHQDPHYHRMPDATIVRRAIHCIAQVGWTEGDNGRGMVNYADLVGFAADEGINNAYVPGLDTDASATATRYVLDLATAPIDNFITEFLPDLASHIHVRIVLVQRIINQAARTETMASQ